MVMSLGDAPFAINPPTIAAVMFLPPMNVILDMLCLLKFSDDGRTDGLEFVHVHQRFGGIIKANLVAHKKGGI